MSRDGAAVAGRSANATATLEMSSNRRLAILWKARDRGQRQRDPDRLDQLVRPLDGLPVAGEVVGQRDLALARRARRGPATRPAPAAPGGVSPIGEPVPRLPPRVAPLRISRDANCGNSSASSGTRPASPRSISDRVSAAPMSILSVADVAGRAARSAGRCRCVSAARACRMLSSTPQSVEPATSLASGCSASRSSASARSAGRTKSPWLLGDVGRRTGAGAGRVDAGAAAGRSASGSPERVRRVADRPVAGAAAQVAAQRVQVEAVRAVLVVVRAGASPGVLGLGAGGGRGDLGR